MNKEELIQDIRRRAFEAGSQKKFAKDNAIHHSHLSQVIRGHRWFSEDQLKRLGYREEVIYLPLEGQPRG